MAVGIEVNVEAGPEGVYLIIKGRKSQNDDLKAALLKEIHRYKLKNIDINALNAALRVYDGYAKILISEDKSPFANDEEVVLEVSKDCMEAYIKFLPPRFEGRKLGEKDIIRFLDDKGIVFGVEKKILKEMTEARNYQKKYVIAKGVPAIKGDDGYIRYFFDTNRKQLKPIKLEDGKVDYRNLDNIETAEEGQLLAKVIEPTDGKDGRDVYGRTIKGIKGKASPKLMAGMGVGLSKDKKELKAQINGQIIYKNDRVSISKILEIREDVGPNIGNINFSGSIVVYGNIQGQYEVIAGGNIEIFGMVEGNKVIAGGNISVSGGIQGRKNTIITATGNLTAKFIINATVYAGGDIYADSIMRCKTKCRGSIELYGSKGVLAGGETYIKDKLTASIIGTPLSAATEVCVGLDPVIYTKYLNMMKSLETLEEKYKAYLRDISVYEKVPFMELSKEKKSAYYGLKYSCRHIKKNILGTKVQIAEILDVLHVRKESGMIEVRKKVYPQVKMQIGNAVIFTKEEIQPSRIINKNGVLEILKR